MEIVDVEKVVYNGYGLAKKGGKIFFIDNVLPGETVKVRERKRKKNFSFAESLEIIKESGDRITPPCKYYGECGGCNFQHIKYSCQLKIKKDIFIETLEKIGGLNFDFHLNIIPSLSPFHYRNSAVLKIKNGEIGFYKKSSHDIVNIEQCMLFHPLLHEKYKIAKKINNKKSGNLKIFYQKGKYEHISDSLFRVSKNSFFQVNAFQIENMVKSVVSNSKECNKFADLYSGVGLFGVILSRLGKEGICIESAGSSHKDAIFNRSLNGINKKRLKLFNMKVEKSYEILRKFKPELLVIDPPRSGMNKDFGKKILMFDFIKKIIYISCNPATLARDLKQLKSNFNLKISYLIDMFPQTYHIESIVVLEKIK